MSFKPVMPSSHLILCRPLLSPSVFPSIRAFSSESVLQIRWPNTGVSASSSVLPMNIQDWLDLLAVQRTLKNLLQHHSSKASILQCSAFFMVQLSNPCITTGKTIALTIWTFVVQPKVLSLHFNVLSRLVIAFLQGANVF